MKPRILIDDSSNRKIISYFSFHSKLGETKKGAISLQGVFLFSRNDVLKYNDVKSKAILILFCWKVVAKFP